MNDAHTPSSDDPIEIPADEEIEIHAPSDIGLASGPRRGDSCSSSDEGRYVCGSLSQVVKCVGGTWRSTNRSC